MAVSIFWFASADDDTPVIDGGWSDWTDWDSCVCNSDTNIASQQRRRECSNPEPQNGGLPCYGDEIDTQLCVNVHCQGEDCEGQQAAWIRFST